MMRRPLARRLVLAALIVLLPAPAARAQGPFTSLTFFGDSYSDTGNARLLAQFIGLPPSEWPAPPPLYYNGRFSNGPVWVDYLAALLGRPADAAPVFLPAPPSGNYAVGGARTVNTGPVPPESPSTQFQIARYLSANAAAVDPTGLYTLFAGGNDMRDIGGDPDPASRQARTIAAATNVVDQVGLLATAGARSILVPYLGNVGLLPESLTIPGRTAILSALSPLFNTTLAMGIAGLREAFPTTTIYELRLDDLFDAVLADARTGGASYGITNTTIPCFAPGAPSCDVSLFVDTQHPTTRGQRIIANAAYTLVAGQAAVPEPATAALVGGGLALLGLGARRRGRSVRGA